MKLPAELKFEDWPKKLEERDSIKALDLAVADLKNNQNVVAVYSMGRKWVPGISDLDLIVVYRDGVSKIHSNDPRNLSGPANYIFTHDYMHFNASIFKNLYYIYPDKIDLKLEFGREISLNNPKNELTENDFKLLEASIVLDFLVTKVLLLPRFFTPDSKKKNIIKVREILLFLYSFTHTIEMTERLTGRKINSAFCQEIRDLRKTWFDLTEEKQKEGLLKAVDDGFNVSALLTEAWDEFLKAELSLNELPKNLVFSPPGLKIIGVEKWNKNDFWQTFLRGTVKMKIPFWGRELKNYKLLVPSSFFAIFSLYAKGKGPYSRWFGMFLKDGDLSVIENNGITKRLEVLNNFPIQKNKKALFTLPFHYGFYTVDYAKELLKAKAVSIKRLLNL